VRGARRAAASFASSRGMRGKGGAKTAAATAATGGGGDSSTAGASYVPPKLVMNCVSCGKIYDFRRVDGVMRPAGEALIENGGACLFCGARLGEERIRASGGGGAKSTETAETAPADDRSMRGRMRGAGQYDATSSASSSAAADAALAAKDRLVQFDRTSAARTTVIDDQSDWFEIDGNAWLDERERAALKKQAAEMEAAEEERRRRRGMHVSIDLLGRRIGAVAVVEEEDEDRVASGATTTARTKDGGDAVPPIDDDGGGGGGGLRVMKNPTASFAPVFAVADAGSAATNTKKTTTTHTSASTDPTAGKRHDASKESGMTGGQAPGGGGGGGGGADTGGGARQLPKPKPKPKRGDRGGAKTGLDSNRRRVLDESPFEAVAREEVRG